jgi:hypothetical protein
MRLGLSMAVAAIVGCQAAPPAERPQDIIPCVWMLRTPMGSGSATVISCVPEGEHWVVTLITAKHVIQMYQALPNYTLSIMREGQQHAGGVVKAVHGSLDVALVQFRVDVPLPVARTSYASLKPFSDVFGCGYAARHFWVSQGLVCDKGRATIMAAPGDSGGAVFNGRGELVGVISRVNMMRHNRAMVHHHVHFVPLSALHEWMAGH